MEPDDYTHETPEGDYVVEMTITTEPVDEDSRDGELLDTSVPAYGQDYDWYDPGFFARVSVNRPLVIFLIIAFLILVIGPSLFYVLNPPRPRPPRPVPGQGIPALRMPFPSPHGQTEPDLVATLRA